MFNKQLLTIIVSLGGLFLTVPLVIIGVVLDHMTFDQKVQIWMVVGTWVAGLATFLAVMTSLHLARRGEKVRLRIFVGIRRVMRGDGSPGEDQLCFDVTNVGDRPVIITNLGWVVGKRTKRRYCIQPRFESWSQQCPVELTHGKKCPVYGFAGQATVLGKRFQGIPR